DVQNATRSPTSGRGAIVVNGTSPHGNWMPASAPTTESVVPEFVISACIAPSSASAMSDLTGTSVAGGAAWSNAASVVRRDVSLATAAAAFLRRSTRTRHTMNHT